MNIQYSSANVPTNMTNSCNREYDLARCERDYNYEFDYVILMNQCSARNYYAHAHSAIKPSAPRT
jgi:hypothetical protein